MPKVDVNLADVCHHITGLEAVLVKILHLEEGSFMYR
jgi:hypothetical protein